jgi:hypothetical protein
LTDSYLSVTVRVTGYPTTITDKLCERVRPPKSGRVEFFDARLPGFSFRVTDKGCKSFSVLYRVNGKKRRLTIGPYTGAPEV